MNNFVIASQSVEKEEVYNAGPALRKRVQELSQIIGALRAIQSSEHWKVLEGNVWSSVTSSLYKRLRNEKDPSEIYKLQGQILWADKYTNLKGLEESFAKELDTITNKLKEYA